MARGDAALITLLITIAVEFLVLWALTRRRPAWLLLSSLLVNCLTQPVASELYRRGTLGFWPLEAVVCLAESVLLMALLPTRYRRALLLSVAANGSTALLSLVLPRAVGTG